VVRADDIRIHLPGVPRASLLPERRFERPSKRYRGQNFALLCSRLARTAAAKRGRALAKGWVQGHRRSVVIRYYTEVAQRATTSRSPLQNCQHRQLLVDRRISRPWRLAVVWPWCGFADLLPACLPERSNGRTLRDSLPWGPTAQTSPSGRRGQVPRGPKGEFRQCRIGSQPVVTAMFDENDAERRVSPDAAD
jgi:hypothetical protein